jgi:hydrogenase expression/formation protein HypC
MCLAIPGRLEERIEDPLMPTGKVSFGGIVKEISLACVPEAKVGDYLLVHAGIGLSVVDEEEAQRVFQYLSEMGELADLEEGEPSSGADAPSPPTSEARKGDAG